MLSRDVSPDITWLRDVRMRRLTPANLRAMKSVTLNRTVTDTRSRRGFLQLIGKLPSLTHLYYADQLLASDIPPIANSQSIRQLEVFAIVPKAMEALLLAPLAQQLTTLTIHTELTSESLTLLQQFHNLSELNVWTRFAPTSVLDLPVQLGSLLAAGANGLALSSIFKLRKLTSLHLTDAEWVSQTEMRGIAAMPALTRLTLKVDAEDFSPLGAMSQLESLCLDNCRMRSQQASSRALLGFQPHFELEFLSSLSNLTRLKLINVHLTNDDMKLLIPLSKLQSLHLVNIFASPRSVGIFDGSGFMHLSGLKQLRTIELGIAPRFSNTVKRSQFDIRHLAALRTITKFEMLYGVHLCEATIQALLKELCALNVGVDVVCKRSVDRVLIEL